jgi:inner membrane protein
VLELNRNFPQSWAGEATPDGTLLATAYGVQLHQPVDTYQRNERAIKYALLFIAITLMTIFLWEHLSGLRLHAVQYFMVGLALSVFYLLLLAFSEHLPFGAAYAIAAAALTALLGIYLAGALRSQRAGALAAGTIASVYGLLYLLVLSEQYALLLGALLVFAVLAAIMLVTRRLDWHELGARD